MNLQVWIPKQQNLPIKIHKYKKHSLSLPQKEKRFIQYLFSIFSFRKKGFIPSLLPLAPKKSPLFRQSRGVPRLSLSSFALAVALTSTLNPMLRTTRGARVRVTRKACNIDFIDSANAESKVTKDNKANLCLKYIFKRVKINRTKCHLLKRCRGGGYIRGRERLRV